MFGRATIRLGIGPHSSYEVVLVSLGLSIGLVTVNAVFSGFEKCNLVPRLTCCDTKIRLILRVIQPGMHVGFNIMRRRIYTDTQA